MQASKTILPLITVTASEKLRGFPTYSSYTKRYIHRYSRFNNQAKICYIKNIEKPISTMETAICNFFYNTQASLNKTKLHTVQETKYNNLNKYLTYIDNKKTKLHESKRLFTEKKTTTNNNHILIYNSKHRVKKFNCKVKTDGVSSYKDTNNDYYTCDSFANAVANGVKPSVFSTVEQIKNNPALDYQHTKKLYNEIAKEAYYFNINQLSAVLKNLATSMHNKNDNTTKGYVLLSYNHAMAINITKKTNTIKIQFYDPSQTNIATKVIILHPDDTEMLNIDDFISWEYKATYFYESKAILLSTEKIKETSAATVNILSDISETDLGFLLALGHYQANQKIKNNIIIKPIISQVISSDLRSIIAGIIPFITTRIPGYYNKVSGFKEACRIKHLDTISNYMNDLLSSNNSIEDKISAIFSPDASAFIFISLATGNSNLWDIIVNSILKNKHINSTEKIMLLNKLNANNINVPCLSIPMCNINNGNDYYTYNTEEILSSFEKIANYILQADDFTEREKIEIINSKRLLDLFWILIPFEDDKSKPYLSFFKIYLTTILNCNKISEQTKKHLIDLDIENTEKDKLYKQAIENKNFKFIFTYIEQIITGNLSFKTKQQLLNIKDKTTFLTIYKEIKATNHKLAKLYLSIVDPHNNS
jgi:hypothetical protein